MTSRSKLVSSRSNTALLTEQDRRFIERLKGVALEALDEGIDPLLMANAALFVGARTLGMIARHENITPDEAVMAISEVMMAAFRDGHDSMSKVRYQAQLTE